MTLGNAAMMQVLGLDTSQSEAEAEADALRAIGKTAMFIADDGAQGGIVAVADPIKDSTAQQTPQKERIMFLKPPHAVSFSTACQSNRPDNCIVQVDVGTEAAVDMRPARIKKK